LYKLCSSTVSILFILYDVYTYNLSVQYTTWLWCIQNFSNLADLKKKSFPVAVPRRSTPTTAPTVWRACHLGRLRSRRIAATVASTAPAVTTPCRRVPRLWRRGKWMQTVDRCQRKPSTWPAGSAGGRKWHALPSICVGRNIVLLLIIIIFLKSKPRLMEQSNVAFFVYSVHLNVIFWNMLVNKNINYLITFFYKQFFF
jgi:hypothetical protein